MSVLIFLSFCLAIGSFLLSIVIVKSEKYKMQIMIGFFGLRVVFRRAEEEIGRITRSRD